MKYPDEVLTGLEKAAIKAANVNDTWRPYYFDMTANGVVVTGCDTRPLTRGKNKGQPKFLINQNNITVVVTREMQEAEEGD